jgi:adenylate cyclase
VPEFHEQQSSRERRISLALLAANMVGVVVVFVVGVWVVPSPVVHHEERVLHLNLILVGLALFIAIPVGGVWANAKWRQASSWIPERRAPTPEERDATIGFPLRLVKLEAALWGIGGVPFTIVNWMDSAELGFSCAVTILLGGITTCALAYLIDERMSRPLVAEALRRTPIEGSGTPALGVRQRLALAWVFGAVVPLIAVAMVGSSALLNVPATPERIGVAVVVVGWVGLFVGLFAFTTTAKTLSEPLMGLRAALGRVEDGDLDVAVPVSDASEVGMLQSGFNRMVHGLRERDRLRDLLDRQVGEDVARASLEDDDVQLGGETRNAAVLFVDLIGSTSMAATWEPHDVVAELNAFFAIVVDCVTLHGGWVNKFEGDAALCVFGAPSAHPDAAGSALATGRVLRDRLERDLPNVRAAIGVSAGTVVAGNVGTPERYEYTVIGDPVNEAARLTDLAKTTPSRLLASDAAVERAAPRERVRWQSGESVELRGRSRPTVIATAV